jgi:hypothetical protein
MQTLQKFSKETAKKFSIDDAIGIAEVIFTLFKKCRENRTPPQEVRANIRQGGGLFARLQARREVKKKLDRSQYTLRQLNRVADYIVDEAMNPARASELDQLVLEVNNAADSNIPASQDEI